VLKHCLGGAERTHMEDTSSFGLDDVRRTSAAAEPRCPSCGGLVAVDAEWCGQCYAPLRAATSVAEATDGAVATPGGGALRVAEGRPAWTCSACGETNAIDEGLCATCGTPFARLFEEPNHRPEIDPENAAVWSLVWPGLGHWKAGYRADAIARAVLFAWTFGALSVLLVSRFGKGGLGATFPLFVLFAGSAATVYGISALDAYRLAAGQDPVVSSRALLWGSAALVVLSVLIATFVTLPAARR
jgi:hypothetical protein